MMSEKETPSWMRWLPAEATATVARLEFAAHGAVEGFLSGRHRSHRKGASTEFAEHRAYVPGDDLRNLDWRVLARHRRYTVKQFVDETNLRATILLDASGSMSWRGEKAAPAAGGNAGAAEPLSKFDYARHLAAALTFLLEKQQDAAGLVAFDSQVRSFVPAKARPSQIRTVLEELDRLTPGGESDIAPVLHEVAERIPPRGVVFLISDLFGDVDALLKALQHFRFRHHEVIVLHVMAEEELSFPFDEFTRFVNAEQPAANMQIDPRALRADYLGRVQEFLRTLSSGCGRLRISYEPLSTATPYERALADVLTRR